MPTITATAGGSGPLLNVSVKSQPIGNMAMRGFWVDLLSGSTVQCSTGYHIGANCLMGVSGSPTTFRAAVKDQQTGLWSEFSSPQSYSAIGNFASGSTEASIGSGAVSDIAIQSPGIEFPDLNMGSGQMSVRRTYVGATKGAWMDEQRAPQWGRALSAFHIVLTDLDQWQSQLISRLWRATNGPQRPFFFDYVGPRLSTNATDLGAPRTTAESARYLVRFRDTSLAMKTEVLTYSSMEFVLSEVGSDPEQDV